MKEELSAGREHILIVDDEPANIRLLSEILSGTYEIFFATNGRQALTISSQKEIDLILLDVMMPDMDGYQVCSALKKDPKTRNIPVIFVSGLTRIGDEIHGLEIGAVDYITKPIRPALVIARVRTHLALKQQTDKLREANRLLEEAEERIAGLAQSTPRTFEDIKKWCMNAAREIADVIGAKEIGVWKVEGKEFVPLVPIRTKAPTLDKVKSAPSDFVTEGEVALIRISGTSSDVLGAVVATGYGILQSISGRRLIAAFAHQLGGVLEMEQMRKSLAEAEENKAVAIREMNRQGISVVRICPLCKVCYDQKTDTCEKDHSPLKTPWVLPSMILNRYRLFKVLGEGGMGIVFQARDVYLHRDVAIKIISTELLHDSVHKLRIRREAQVIAQIQSPGIVAVHDFGQLKDGSAFMVMEFLKGVDLGETLKEEGPGTPKQIAGVLLQVGEALEATHRKGVIHRDLKPSNLFAIPSDNGFQLKLLDFGVAKSMLHDISLTATGLLVGTPCYMSPEQVRGHVIDEQSDLFSLACVTYELLTGERPFEKENVAEVLAQILHQDPPPVSSRLKNALPELDQAFYAALAKDPADRPGDLLSWCKEVATLLQGVPSSYPGWLFPSFQKLI